MNIFNIIAKVPNYIYLRTTYFLKWSVMAFQKGFPLNPISYNLRPWLWRMVGVNSKGKFRVGYDVYFDVGNANLIWIEDGVWIASRCLIICHKRILKDYYYGDDYNKLPFKQMPVVLKRGCCIGMGSIIMPGVTVGEGAIVGAGSVVTRDVPPYTIATGSPAVVIRELKCRELDT